MDSVDRLELRWMGDPTEAVGIAVLFHGGARDHPIPNRWQSLPYLSMIPFGRAIRKRSRGRIAVALPFNPANGWVAHSGRAAAARLLESIRRDYPVPMALVGHSSGGWAVLELGDRPGVTDVVALSPWLPVGQATDRLRGRRVVVAHGANDPVTSPSMSAAYVELLRRDGVQARFAAVPHTNHALIPGRIWWHLGVARYVVAALADEAARRA